MLPWSPLLLALLFSSVLKGDLLLPLLCFVVIVLVLLVVVELLLYLAEWE